MASARSNSPNGSNTPAKGRGSSGGGSNNMLLDLIDRILDKGIVIDAWVRVSVLSIELLTVEARVVVASVDTYLRYAEAIGNTALASQPRPQQAQQPQVAPQQAQQQAQPQQQAPALPQPQQQNGMPQWQAQPQQPQQAQQNGMAQPQQQRQTPYQQPQQPQQPQQQPQQPQQQQSRQ